MATFLPQEIIRKKRDGQALTGEEIASIVAGLTAGSVSEGQVAAFAMAVFFNGMTPRRGGGADARHARFRHGARLVAPAGPRPRQAFHRRHRRQCFAHAGAGARRLWRLCADDLRPRPRPYRRHPRQARFDPRLPHPAGPRSSAQGGGRSRLRRHRPDRGSGAGRQAPLRHPRRHRDGRIDPADHRLDPVEEARRRPCRPRPRREDRQRRLHGQDGGFGRAGEEPGHRRQRRRHEDQRPHHRHEPAAGLGRRQRRRGDERGRIPQGQSRSPPVRGHRRAGRQSCSPPAASPATTPMAARRSKRLSRPAVRRKSSGRWSPPSAAPPTSWRSRRNT